MIVPHIQLFTNSQQPTKIFAPRCCVQRLTTHNFELPSEVSVAELDDLLLWFKGFKDVPAPSDVQGDTRCVQPLKEWDADISTAIPIGFDQDHALNHKIPV